MVLVSSPLLHIWDKWTSWLPNLEWLKHAFVVILIVIVLGIICVLLQCFVWCCQRTIIRHNDFFVVAKWFAKVTRKGGNEWWVMYHLSKGWCNYVYLKAGKHPRALIANMRDVLIAESLDLSPSKRLSGPKSLLFTQRGKDKDLNHGH